MKALRLFGQHDLKLLDESVPVPAPGEALLRVKAVGICGSDLHWFDEMGIGDARLSKPLVLGHEFAATRLDDHRLVAVDPALPCGRCEFCATGQTNLCPDILFAGHGVIDGALRECMSWPEKNLYPLGERLDAVDGVMLEPLGVALFALDLANLRVGMRVGIFGCGPIGLLILQLARMAGAGYILATDRLPHRVQAAAGLEADEAMLTAPDGMIPEGAVKKLGSGLDVIFEAAGDNPAVESACKAAKPGATVVLAGIPADDKTQFKASLSRRKGLTFHMCRRMRHTYPRAIELVQSGRVDVRSLVTHRYPLDRAQEAFRAASRRDGIKVIIEV